ncbi:hypothetical protein E8F11_11390 [Pseudomonas sp. BN417]|uniref:hypothetical protein n=1 Tax=Pseudomonas sp. BN417 TaxID=2567890 RepID=UPI002456BB88|nr:hypothetical protein [Pseudomonas sp. BN417]MDH4555767.1 hypothetical protein [Pseudomonas sp. BN417]
MNKAQRLFVEWSLGTTLLLASVGWAVMLVWAIETPFLADHPLHFFTQDALALDRVLLVDAAKFLGVFLWVWFSVLVRVGRKKEPKHLPPVG